MNSQRSKIQLLQVELDCHGEVHRNRLTIKRGRLVLPLTQCVHSGLVK